MKSWLLRGLGLAVVHVVVRVLLGAALIQWPLQGSVLRWAGLVVVILAAVAWAGLDGIRDRRAHPDPDDGDDLTMRWLAAGAVTGLVGGFVTWLVDTVTAIPVGVKSLFFELTSGAAFTVLLVFLPAMVAVGVGRYLVRHDKPGDEDWADHSNRPEREHAMAAQGASTADSTRDTAATEAWRNEEAPTEVFPAVDPTTRNRDA
ncbi:B-4DMT family transporter [Rhodococcus sp. HNM0563]|uniref:B-4DMT family transporter n=1 Tax=unclassified Rhodococcus (in: high G+C Gram-positive bacteria) TaxID=192944 RepID=UPI00146D742F|nr:MULTISPECIES: B-4DMT family transporter [unclassified Rhodococcus (in: high G+C Gram-positive bacteria)]MCK0093234.1 B-4DMT family transporter [Rhodococcus sp. F64268]NLU65213.1 B-4DMT family transporter [Rhodococcus sp. HNM0563]